MHEWTNFFLGELGAAAALAGLLFVSISMNQARILELGRMADRGMESLLMLLLVLVVASLALMPGQPLRLLGLEILLAGVAAIGVSLPLQRAYLRGLDPVHHRRTSRMVFVNRLAQGLIAASGLVVLGRGDTAGFYVLALGILASFFGAGGNAWVLLVEISR